MKLRPFLLELKPGTRVVSNTFQMEDWIPDSTLRADEDCHFWCDAYLWIVPAKINGIWKISGEELSINQEFQKFSGTLKKGKKIKRISDGKIRGNQIVFKMGHQRYSGTINDNCIEGSVTSGRKSKKWQAERYVAKL